MSDNSSLPNINPGVYLNYLQPEVATPYEVIRDLFFVTFGALAWDILSSIPSDWIIIRTTKPSPVLFAYFSARPCALAVVLMSALAKTGPVRDCGVLQLINNIFFVIASACSSYLFLKRAHAVFFQERFIRYAFTALWIAAFGASMLLFVAPLHDYYEIANTQHCMNDNVKSYISVAFVVSMAFDVIVYFAITFRILMFHPRTTTAHRSWLKRLCDKRTLPRLSRAVLEGGQQYYSITDGVNITRIVWALMPGVSPVLQLSLSVPALALTSAMACRVFRNLKLELKGKTEVEALTTLHFATKENPPKNAEFAKPDADLERC